MRSRDVSTMDPERSWAVS